MKFIEQQKKNALSTTHDFKELYITHIENNFTFIHTTKLNSNLTDPTRQSFITRKKNALSTTHDLKGLYITHRK